MFTTLLYKGFLKVFIGILRSTIKIKMQLHIGLAPLMWITK